MSCVYESGSAGKVLPLKKGSRRFYCFFLDIKGIYLPFIPDEPAQPQGVVAVPHCGVYGDIAFLEQLPVDLFCPSAGGACIKFMHGKPPL